MSQLFKYKIEKDFITDFLLKYCLHDKKKEYLFNPIAFKKIMYDKKLEEFINHVRDCYHTSKRFYIERDMTYKNFLTILRQVCKHLDIPYTSKIVYNKSKYTIHYTIYLTSDNDISNNDISNNDM